MVNINEPLVSVIIPTFNRVDLAAEAIESVRRQKMGDFELVVVDDGSTDGTEERVSKSAMSDSRIIYYRITHIGCPGAVRNVGAGVSKSRFIAFLDSDDMWLPEKLEKQIAVLIGGGRRICHTRERWLRNGREISQAGQRHRREGELFCDSLAKCIIGPSTVMLERTLFEEVNGFREDLEIAEDYELWLRITAIASVEYVDEPLTIKRAGHRDQLSEKHGQIEIFRIRALRDLVDSGYFETSDNRSPKKNLDGLARKELARKCRIYAAGARKRGRVREADEYESLSARYGRENSL